MTSLAGQNVKKELLDFLIIHGGHYETYCIVTVDRSTIRIASHHSNFQSRITQRSTDRIIGHDITVDDVTSKDDITSK